MNDIAGLVSVLGAVGTAVWYLASEIRGVKDSIGALSTGMEHMREARQKQDARIIRLERKLVGKR